MKNNKNKYNEIEVKDNMKIEEVEPEVVEKKEMKTIVSAKPKKVKKNLVSRLVNGVLGPDGVPSIGAYVNEEIIKPAVKNIIVDAVTSGINMIMYGEKAPRRGEGTRYGGARTTSTSRYTNYSAVHRTQQEVTTERKVHSARYIVEEYIIEDRYDASHVLTSLTESADMYQTVSVADYYDLIGVNSKYTDNSYGWTLDSISRATIVPVRGGYVIKFPTVEPI